MFVGFLYIFLGEMSIQDMETTPMSSTDDWIRKMWYIYTMECCSVIKKNNAICSNMDGTRDSHTERSKPERERQIPYITYIWNLIHGTNEPFHRRETHGHGD